MRPRSQPSLFQAWKTTNGQYYCNKSYTTSSSRPPSRSFFRRDAIMPFILLSTMTSLAFNLSHSKSTLKHQSSILNAQISVLQSLIDRETLRAGTPLTKGEEEDNERQLELVGLGRAKGKERDVNEFENAVKSKFGRTAWREVFFGKKGKEWEEEGDQKAQAEWDQALLEASVQESKTLPPVVEVASASAPSTPTTGRPSTPPSANSKPSSAKDVYL
ncbi:hypothetical protein T439DRAFT_320345 [Meredithblackwellia eburnea MCA 4105]